MERLLSPDTAWCHSRDGHGMHSISKLLWAFRADLSCLIGGGKTSWTTAVDWMGHCSPGRHQCCQTE